MTDQPKTPREERMSWYGPSTTQEAEKALEVLRAGHRQGDLPETAHACSMCHQSWPCATERALRSLRTQHTRMEQALAHIMKHESGEWGTAPGHYCHIGEDAESVARWGLDD